MACLTVVLVTRLGLDWPGQGWNCRPVMLYPWKVEPWKLRLALEDRNDAVTVGLVTFTRRASRERLQSVQW
jgi:hypothetical protein